MTSDRWLKIEEIYHTALKVEENQRAIFLDQACQGDEGLRREVESLLASDAQAADFMEAPAVELLARGITDVGLSSFIGQQLGTYQILALLGAGGMGEVYKARDTRLNRTVAIKILSRQLTERADLRHRFEREANLLASLNHPNIASIYGLEESSDVQALVMELVEGPTLAERIEEGLIPMNEALPIARQMAEALEYAHEKGIIHRDLKPANVKLTEEGVVKLLDFGLAKALEAPPTSNPSPLGEGENSPTLGAATESGIILGTAAYMAPEQARGKGVDQRADIWAFGVVFYEMLTGKRLFRGETTSDTMASVLKTEPDWSVLPAGVPLPIRRLLRRCLDRDAKTRLRDIGEARVAIAKYLADPESGAEDLPRWIGESSSEVASLSPGSSRTKWRELGLGGLASVLALVTLFLAYAHFHRHVDLPAPTTSSILPPGNTAFASYGFALSPDGMHLAFIAQSVDGRRTLWVRPLNSLVAQELSGTGDASFPFWSPDSQWIAFFAVGKLKKIPANGGAAQEICDAPLGRGGTWNSRGVIVLARSINGPIFRVSAGGGTPTSLTRLDPATGETTHRWPDFLPDGIHFLYLARQTSEKQPAGVYIGSLDDSSRKKVLDGPSNAQYAEPGYLLFVRNTTLFAQRFLLRDLKVEGEEIPIVTDVQRIEGGALWDGVDVSPRGQIVYRSTGYESDTELIVTSRLGKLISSFPAEGFVAYVSLSPDGQKMAVSAYSGGMGNLWIYDLARQLHTKFTFSGGLQVNPTWSPDGSQLAFASTRAGPFNMYLKPASGAAEEKAIHPSPDDERPQSWSPDGKYLVYDRRPTSRQGVPEIMILPLVGEQKPYSFLNAPYANSAGQVSSDGRWIAFVSNQSGRTEVCVSTFPEGRGPWQVSTAGGRTPRWQRDGRILYYARSDGVLIATEVTPGRDSFSVGASAPVLERHLAWGAIEAPYAVFPDGQRFVTDCVKEGSLHAPLTLLTNATAALKP